MKQYFQHLTLCIGAGIIFLSASVPVQAATCIIKGMNLVMAEAKARGNGYKVNCIMFHNRHKTVMRNYLIPGPNAKVGCKGRQAFPNVQTQNRRTTRNELAMVVYRDKLKHGWTITDLQVRGSGRILKSAVSKNIVSMPAPGIGKSFDVYASKLYLKHPSKSCHNIAAVLTDAFGH